ncbi:phenylacetate--CoA ligase family protein [Tamlana sp. 2_MG-2023]|uniref:phenylacetate--CoA ligase family protein n=1 Tax=unclassified Tamlana TaxID=2614803 RepID=UPI0026E20909|nr:MULTISPECIES: phenylacetate--CoA ligase family protein [unclassified Tamlana]MDO6759761.1 phenylacetate--CoA ligase family protein [Tamlana sp. 2_MG-2023]MDO6791384.1 phenylacetate--CoA ligase family protein [Tamlana sp. 1_MG-2023]
MNLFKFSLQINGFPLKKASRMLETIQEAIAVDYDAYIHAKKQDIVNYHLKNNAFYKSFVNAENYTDWNALPIMTKGDLQQPLKDRLSEGFWKKNIYINKTSGSSGTPFLFAKDKFCHALIWANFINRYNWFNLDLHTSKQARFYGIPLDKKGYYKERLKDRLSNRFRFSVFDLSDKQLEKNLEIFKSTPFDYINGYTSAIVLFAKFLKKKNIVLKTICPSLKACIVTSEMLFESDKALLEAQFGISIINEYGAAELGLIAFQNKKDEWQINNEDLFVEILDDNNNVLPYGEIGRIVITSLYNKAHPFIRYDLGDLGALSESSTPEKPILKSLHGRTSDLVQLPSGKTAAGLTFYYVTKTIIEDKSAVKEFVIEQLKLDAFKISYVSEKTLSEGKIEAIEKAIETYLEANLKIIFEQKTCLNRSNRGKLKQFTSFL